MNIYTSLNGKQNKKVIFVLSGWRNKLWMYSLTSKILSRNGFYCRIYVYDKDILSPDTKQTAINITNVRDNVLMEIQKLKQEGYKDFSIFGISLGSLIALMVANKSSDISRIVLNLTGSDIAEAVWSWKINTNAHFKRELLKQNYTLEKLQHAWKTIAPINNIDNLKNKKILVYLSRRDKLIPYKVGSDLIQELQNKGYDCRVILNKWFGHGLTANYNLLRPKVYLDFLKSAF